MPTGTATKKTAAKKTAAKKTAAKKTASPAKKTASNPPQSFLYRLPKGWTYSVDIDGPDGTRVLIEPHQDVSDKFSLTVVTPDGNERTMTVDDMPSGLKQAATAVKSLDKVAQREAALAEARDEALGFLDSGSNTGDAQGKASTKAPAPEPEGDEDGEGDEPTPVGSSAVDLNDVD